MKIQKIHCMSIKCYLFTATHEQDPSGGECQTPTPTQGSKRKLVLRAARTPSPVNDNDPSTKLNKCQDEEPSISSNTTDPDWKTQVGKKYCLIKC